jgi:hypothetical protein
MALITEKNQLPERIQAVLNEQGQQSKFVCAIKTDYKPNATIPILWLVLTETDFMLCNTHKTRGLTAKHPWNAIDTVRKKATTGKANTIEILYTQLSDDDTVLPLPSSVTNEDIQKLLVECQNLINSNK